MDIIENLIRYTEYSKGNLSKKCSMEYEDIDIRDMIFSEYDLNNSSFCGVNFFSCDFSDVYLSGSNFGGSYFGNCILKENIIKKAVWDDIIFERTEISLMDAFRTTFMFGRFLDTRFSKCCMNRCLFTESEFKNVDFIESTFVDADFTKCKFENVHFIDCKFENVVFDKNLKEQEVFFS